MKSVIVTIAGPDEKVDLTVPAETPIDQLMPTFRSLGVVDEQSLNGTPLGLGRMGEPLLPGRSTLEECGVVDGTILQLRAVEPEEQPEPEPESRTVTYEEFREEREQEDLKRRAGYPLRRTEAGLPPIPQFNDRLMDAMGAWFKSDAPRRVPPAMPQRPPEGDDEAPIARPMDLTDSRAPSRSKRAKAVWRSSAYLSQLEALISEPRLRRCATIAVVSPKGGVGKTTTSALLGSLFSRVRHERMVAVDTNPDYGSLGRALTPDHRVFVDDLVDVLDHPDLTVAELERKLGRAFDGLLVLPAPTDPSRMARLDEAAYEKVCEQLKKVVGGLVLDCGTGLQEPAARAAIKAADQIVLVSDAEPSTASLVAEAAQLLKRAGKPIYLVVNKMPRKGARLDVEMLDRAVPDARALIAVRADPESASALNAGDFTWEDAPDPWQRAVRELAVLLVADWPGLGLST